MKFFAGTCADETDAACMRIFQNATEQHEQYQRSVLLAAIIVLSAIATMLILYLLVQSHKN